jgi:general secretion pathway protein L
MPQRILGLDIGSWSVKGIIAEDRFRSFVVTQVHEVKIEPGPPETLPERKVEAIEALLAEEHEKVDVTISALPAETVSVRMIELPFADAKKVDQIMEGELADLIPFDIDDGVFDHEFIRKSQDGSLSVGAVVKRSAIKAWLDVVNEAGVDPKHLGVDTLQLFNLYSHYIRDDASKAQPPPQGTDLQVDDGDAKIQLPDARLIVDIGHERTLICAASEEGIAFARAIRTGGADVTRALAKACQCEWADAEFLKHEEGFIASSRHPAPDERAQNMSTIVESGLNLLVSELRRSLQSIRTEKRVRVRRIDLVGGGSRIRNLTNYLAEQLQIPTGQSVVVEQAIERETDQAVARRPAFAGALANVLRSVGQDESSEIDLRVGDFMFAGQLQHLRTRFPAIAIAAAILTCLLMVNAWASYQALVKRENMIDRQFCEVTKKTIGREICEPKRAISVMQSPTSELGNLALPSRSALNIAAELSDRIPKKLDVHVREMVIAPKRAKIRGETTSLDAVDQIVAGYSKDPCYSNIRKGKLRRMASGQRFEFVLTIQLECS